MQPVPPMNRKRLRLLIFATILVHFVGMGILYPILPDVFRRFTPDEGEVSQLFGIFAAIYYVLNFFASPLLGALSDRWGRRPLILFSSFGGAIDFLIMAFAPNLAILFLGRILSGISGSILLVANSYISDIGQEDERAADFGIVTAAVGIGIILGPALGGTLSVLGAQVPFVVAALLNLMNFIFCLLVLPESLPVHERSTQFRRDKINPLAPVAMLFQTRFNRTILWVYVLGTLAGHVHNSNWTLYLQAKFGWSPTEVGISVSVFGILYAVSLLAVTPFLAKSLREKRSLLLSLSALTFLYFSYAWATASWMIYATLCLTIITGTAMPLAMALITRGTAKSEMGEKLGGLNSLSGLAGVIAPLLYTWLFTSFGQPGTNQGFLGAAYAGAGVLSLLSLILYAALFFRKLLP